MDYVNSDTSKEIVRICLFKNKLSLFKEVAIFSINIISFKIGFIGTVKFSFFRHFWFRTSCIGYVNCESAKDLVRMCLFEEKWSLFKELQFSL